MFCLIVMRYVVDITLHVTKLYFDGILITFDVRVRRMTSDDRYVVKWGTLLGEGHSATVYECEDTATEGRQPFPLCAKVFSYDSSHEFAVYRAVSSMFPDDNLWPAVLARKSRCMVMQRLGSSLAKVLDKCNHLPLDFVFRYVAMILMTTQLFVRRAGVRMVSQLEQLHKAGYVMESVKPENICLGYGQSVDDADATAYLIDVGIVSLHRSCSPCSRPRLADH